MPGWAGIVAAAVQGAVSALLAPLTRFFQKRDDEAEGALKQTATNQKATIEIKEDQLRAAANRPDTAADLDKRLRSGDF